MHVPLTSRPAGERVELVGHRRPGTTGLRRGVLLAGLSAAAATTHEVAWAQLLPRLVGNTSHGRGLALGLFMFGMGLGSVLARSLLVRGVRGRRGYVASEVLISLSGGLAAAVYLSDFVPSVAVGGGLVTDVAFGVAVALPASLAIGMTYPFLVAATDSREATGVSWLYAAGLFGGVAGVVVSGFLVVPRLGADVAAYGAAAVNLLVAGTASVLLRQEQPLAPLVPNASLATVRVPTVLFTAAGIFGLGSQVVWNRTVVPYAGVSVFTFSTIIATYLLAQALAIVASRRMSVKRATSLAWPVLVLLPVLTLLALGVGPAVESGGQVRSQGLAWLGQSLSVVFVTVAPPAFAIGLVQAAALRGLEAREYGHAAAAGFVTGVATAVGALAGVLTSLAVTPLAGPRGTIAVLALPLGIALAAGPEHRLLRVAGLSAFTALGLWSSPGPPYFLGSAFDDAAVLYVDVNPQDTTAIVLHDRPTEPRIRHLVANGVSYSGDGLLAQRYMRALGHIPALAASGQERALVICIGTGSTAGALLSHPFRHVDAVDISPSIRETLRYFSHVDGGLPESSRAEIHIADGIRFLAVSDETWDVITLEPPPPRAPGASALYSTQFYQLAADHLAPGGAVAQWLPLHGLTSIEIRSIVGTFVDAFLHTSLHLVERNEAVLLGRESSSERAGRAPAERVRQDLAQIGLDVADPLHETEVGSAELLDELTQGAPRIRYAWPIPELTPLHGLPTMPADAWLEELVRGAERDGLMSSTSGYAFLGVAPSFIRVQEGRGTVRDRAIVRSGLVAWLAADPEEPYRQYVFGYGSLLERRLERLVDEFSAAEHDELSRQLEANRTTAQGLLTRER